MDGRIWHRKAMAVCACPRDHVPNVRAGGRVSITWHLRDFEPADLEAIVRLDAESGTTDQPPAFTLADVIDCLGRCPAVVATAAGRLVGVAVSRVDHDRAWVVRIALSPQWRRRGLGSALLSELEHRLQAASVSRISALL